MTIFDNSRVCGAAFQLALESSRAIQHARVTGSVCEVSEAAL